MQLWRRIRDRRTAEEQPPAEAPRPADDDARQARQAISPERFDRTVLHRLDPA